MKAIPLTTETEAVARRLVWIEEPAAALATRSGLWRMRWRGRRMRTLLADLNAVRMRACGR
jgi:hypothetical protein